MPITSCTQTFLGNLTESPSGTIAGIPIGTAFSDRLVTILYAGNHSGASLSGAVGGTNVSGAWISAFIPAGTTTTLTLTGSDGLGGDALVYAIAGAGSNVPSDQQVVQGSLVGGSAPPLTANVPVANGGAILALAGRGGSFPTFSSGVDADGSVVSGGLRLIGGSREYATGGTYAVTSPDADAYLITAAFDGGASAPTDPPVNTAVPVLSDTTPVVGQTIATTDGTWTNSPTGYAYRWFLDGVPIAGATSSSYTVQAADAGKALSSGVIATNGAGSSAEAVSAASSAIAHTWQIVGVAVSSINTSGNYTLTLPAGSQANDVIVAAISTRSNVGFTVPSGWTLANQDTGGNTTNNTTASDTSSMQAYIIRGASAPSMVFTRSGGSRALGVVAVYRYTDQSGAPTFDASALTPLAAASTTVSGAGLTTAAAGELIVSAFFGARNVTVSNFRATNPATGSGATNATSAPLEGAWTERADALNGTSPTVSIALADSVRVAAGATGNIITTASASALHAIGAMAFRPPVAAPPGGSATGTASGSASVQGAGAATARSTGSSSATSTASASGRSTHAAAGSASASALVSCAGAALTPSVGSAGGSATAQGIGSSAIAAIGSGAGAATVQGQGAALGTGLGQSESSALAQGVGAARSSSSGASGGLATVQGAGSSTARATGQASGSASAQGVGASAVAASGVASGSSVAEGAGAGIATAIGAAAGSSQVAGLSGSASTVSAVGSAAGSSLASGQGSALARSVGSSAGAALASAQGSARSAASGTASASSTASALARSVAASAGSAQGSAIVEAVGRSLTQAEGLASGSAQAAAVGTALAPAAGLAAGSSSAIGQGAEVETTPPRIIPLIGIVSDIVQLAGTVQGPITVASAVAGSLALRGVRPPSAIDVPGRVQQTIQLQGQV